MRFRKEAGGADGWSRWVQPKMSSYYLKCCDCGLVHRMQFRIHGTHGGARQHVQFRARRSRGPRKRA